MKYKYNLFANCLDCFKIIQIRIQSWSFLTIEATDVQFLKNKLSYSFLVWAENSKILMSWWDCGVWAGLTINISCLPRAVLCLPLRHQLHSCINYPKRFLMSIQCETPELCHGGLYVPTLQSLSSQYVSLGKYLLCLWIIHFDISRVLWPVHHSPSNIRQSIQQIILYCVQ